MTTIHEHPFTKINDNGSLDLWAVEPTGNYAADCATGNNYFEQLRFHAEREKSSMGIEYVLQAMIDKGSVSGIEVGFLHSLASAVV